MNYKDMNDEEFFKHVVYLIAFIVKKFSPNQIDYIIKALQMYKNEVQP